MSDIARQENELTERITPWKYMSDYQIAGKNYNQNGASLVITMNIGGHI